GTSGKTTTTYLVEAALSGAGALSGIIGTTGSRVDGHALVSRLTTPEAPEFQALLARMRDQDARAVAAEVSSHALRLGRAGGTRCAVGAFLSLSRDRLDFHPDMEEGADGDARPVHASQSQGVARDLRGDGAGVLIAHAREQCLELRGLRGGQTTDQRVAVHTTARGADDPGERSGAGQRGLHEVRRR